MAIPATEGGDAHIYDLEIGPGIVNGSSCG
jgi:hypothetical protein